MKVHVNYSTFEKNVAGFVSRNFPEEFKKLETFEYQTTNTTILDAYLNIANLMLLREVTGQQDGLLHETMITDLIFRTNSTFNLSIEKVEISRLSNELRNLAKLR